MANQQNQQVDYSPTQEGLPQADDYDPDAIGTAQLEAGDAEQTWPEYGLEMVPVLHDGDDTGRRLLRRNGNYLADVSDRYQLLPNERAVATANEVAKELGAVPFHEWSREDGSEEDSWSDDGWFVKLDDHVFQDTERRRVHALYAWGEPADITGDGDTVQFGFSVHNSIDSSLSFQVGLFSYRYACANMVTMAVKDTSAGTFNTGAFDARNVEDEREILAHSSRKHTSGLDISKPALKGRIQLTLTAVDPELDGSMDGGLVETYRNWRDEAITPELTQGLVNLVRQGYLPADDVPEWVAEAIEDIEAVEANEDLSGREQAERKTAVLEADTPDESVWQVYNSVSETVWHSDNSDTTKQRKYRQLHKVFQPAPGIR